MILTLYEKSLRCWVKTATKNPIEWLIILLSLLYALNVDDRFKTHHLANTATADREHSEQQQVGPGSAAGLGTKPYVPGLGLPAENQLNSINIRMIIRIWCGLHIYKHLNILNKSLIKCSKTTQFYTCLILSSLFLLSIAVLCTVFPTFNQFQFQVNSLEQFSSSFDRITVFLLVSDLKYLATLTLHAMTSINKEELTDKISLGMLLMTPDRFAISILDSLAIGFGIYSYSPILQNLAVDASSAIMTNLVIFIIFMPIFLSLLLHHPSDQNLETLDNYNHQFLLSPMANWYVSRRKNYLETENYSHYCRNNKIFNYKLSLKAQVLLIFNILTNSFFKRLAGTLPEVFKIVSARVLELTTPWASTVFISALLYHYLFKNLERAQSSSSSLSPSSNLKSPLISQRKGSISAAAATKTASDFSESSNSHSSQKPAPISSRARLPSSLSQLNEQPQPQNRPLHVLTKLYTEHGPDLLSDNEVIVLLNEKIIRPHQLEKILDTPMRAVAIRRRFLGLTPMSKLPFKTFSDYPIATKACCENMIGYMPVPVGIAGPLKINGNTTNLPFATTEGALIASTCRGAKAINLSGGCLAVIYRDGMTRAPVVRFSSLNRCLEFVEYLESPANFKILKEKFEETTRFGKLTQIKVVMQGRNAYLRFSATTGDAMGMNMVSKGTEHILKFLKQANPEFFPDMQVISLSSNFCTDKKSAAVNWVEGRGKSVIVEATIKKEVLNGVLKVNAGALALLNKEKNLKGSALAGSVGGFNAHAANIVAASFIATGQDPAQVVDSSMCLIDMEEQANGDLYMSCTMPCMEVGTIGGGTNLSAQKAAIDIAVDGWSDHWREQYNSSSLLAKTVAGFVLAGELSLCSSLCVGDLVQSHLKLNRIQVEQGNDGGNHVL